jgi:hypothetical protein
MNFFKKIFNRNNTNDNLGLSEDSSNLQILGNAICDIGWWSWWTAELPKVVQIEFGGTQLFFQPNVDGNPPNNQIAIQFINPKSISFLSRSKELIENWPKLLETDKLELPSCDYENFTFIDENVMKNIIDEALIVNTIHGYSPKETAFYKEKYKLVFWAQDYGFAVNAEELKLMSHKGKIELDDIPEINNCWWNYWKKYWSLRDTESPLPKDNLCEITIPAEKFKFSKEA